MQPMPSFEHETWRECFIRVMRGLRAPRDSGDYKAAIRSLERTIGPSAAALTVCLMVLLLLFTFVTPQTLPHETEIEVQVVEAETVELDFDEPDLPEPEPLDPSELAIAPVTPPESAIPLVSDVEHETLDPRDDRSDLIDDTPLITASPVILRGLYGSRTPEGRAAALGQHAGDHGGDTESAVLRALQWLKENQRDDGSWRGEGNARSPTAMTGLALLAFLAHGETPGSEYFGPTVRRALVFLIETDQRDDGTFRNTEGGQRGGVYAHGIASYALSEAFALTRIMEIRPAMEKAIAHIVRGQRPDGGYDYRFERDGGARDRCTSVAGWMAQAMKAAHMAGANVPGLEDAMENAARGFKRQYVGDAGHFMYASNSGGVRHSMTPIGVLCLQLLGHGRSAEARGGLRAIANWAPSWSNPDMSGGILEPVYVWYYAAQAFFHQGGPTWQQWNNHFAPMLVDNQNDDGSWSWSHGRSAEYGPVYHTVFNALSLMVYYRYLPTYAEIKITDTDIDAGSEYDVEIQIY